MKLSAILLALCLSACAHVGTDFDASKLADLRPGMTVAEVSAELGGKPRSVGHGASGNTSYVWSYGEKTPLMRARAKMAVVLFGPDGKMIRVASNTLAD